MLLFLSSGINRASVLLSMLVLSIGCSRKPTIAPVLAFPIPVQVFVHLGPDEQIGDPTNAGCRLTTEEITDLVKHMLSQQTTVFGPHSNMVWGADSPITVFRDPTLNNVISDRETYTVGSFNTALQYAQQLGIPGPPIRTALNIYFTGNIVNGRWPFPPEDVEGFAVPPCDADPSLMPGYVFLNDGDIPGGWSANGLKLLNVLLHEVGHFFSDDELDDRTFGAGKYRREYDEAGHELLPQPTLMDEYAPYYGHLFGTSCDAMGSGGTDEKGILTRRIVNGTWLND